MVHEMHERPVCPAHPHPPGVARMLAQGILLGPQPLRQVLVGDASNPDVARGKYRELAELISGRISPYTATAGAAGTTYFTQGR